MRTLTVFIAGALVALPGIASPTDNLVEERHKAKYGRYTPAEEKRRSTLKPVQASNEMPDHACCKRVAGGETLMPAASEAWHRAKFGRNTPRFENAIRAADVELVAHEKKCTELGRCAVAVAKADSAGRNTDSWNVSEADEARLRMRLGMTAPRRGFRRATEDKPIIAAREYVSCGEPCCNNAE